MPANKWNEEGKVWKADHGLLDEEQVAKCARAYAAASTDFVFAELASKGALLAAEGSYRMRMACGGSSNCQSPL